MTEDASVILRALDAIPDYEDVGGWINSPIKIEAKETLAAILAELECWKRRAERAEGELCYMGKLGLD